MKYIDLDVEDKFFIAMGFIVRHKALTEDEAITIMLELQEKLGIRINNLADFKIGMWVNEIIGSEVFQEVKENV